MAGFQNAIQAQALAAATADDFLDELTIMLNVVSVLLERTDWDDPNHELLIEAQASAERAAVKAAGLQAAMKGR